MAGFDVSQLLNPLAQSAASLPQTQADVKELASAAKTVQSPEFQAQVETAKIAGASYAGLTLLFQGLTAAGVLYIAYHLYKKGKL